MKREYKNKLDSILKRIASKIPGVTGIEPHVTEDNVFFCALMTDLLKTHFSLSKCQMVH